MDRLLLVTAAHVLTVLIYFDFQIINKGPQIYPTYWVLRTKESLLSLTPSSYT